MKIEFDVPMETEEEIAARIDKYTEIYKGFDAQKILADDLDQVVRWIDNDGMTFASLTDMIDYLKGKKDETEKKNLNVRGQKSPVVTSEPLIYQTVIDYIGTHIQDYEKKLESTDMPPLEWLRGCAKVEKLDKVENLNMMCLLAEHEMEKIRLLIVRDDPKYGSAGTVAMKLYYLFHQTILHDIFMNSDPGSLEYDEVDPWADIFDLHKIRLDRDDDDELAKLAEPLLAEENAPKHRE